MSTTTRPSLLASLGSASLHPNLSRATRATTAFLIPLILSSTVGLPVSVIFAAIAAQNIAQLDVRGAYPIRFMLLVTVTLVLTCCAALGVAVSDNLPLAVAGTVLIALGAALWRHLCADYALGIIVSTCLLYLLGIAHPDSAHGSAVLGALAGGAIGMTIQTALWPWRARHPLRQAVSGSWTRAADLFTLCLSGDKSTATTLVRDEAALRLAVDQAREVLAGAGRHHDPRVLENLVTLNILAARLSVRAVSILTALECSGERNLRQRLAPSLEPLFNNLTNCARSVAIAIVSRDPAHLALCEVRFARLRALLTSTRARLLALHPKSAVDSSLSEVWGQMETVAEEVPGLLTPIVDRSGDGLRFPRELLDLETWQLRPLAASLNFSSRIDPLLVRYGVRLACLSAIATGIWRHYDISHGYWLPLTIFVVLQPAYGPTLSRAVQRIIGTLAGSVVAGLLMLVAVPLPLRIAGIGIGVFTFAFYLKSRYAVAVFSVTIFIMLLLGLHGESSPNLILERGCITLGAGLATLIGAARLWPEDERKRIQKKLTTAFASSRTYLLQVISRLPAGPGVDEDLLNAKRSAERAAAAVFTTLNTVVSDRSLAGETRRTTSLAHGNQRLLRVANLLLVQTGKGPATPPPAHEPVVLALDHGLELLTSCCEGRGDAGRVAQLITEIDTLPPATNDEDSLHRRLLQAANEVRALLAAV